MTISFFVLAIISGAAANISALLITTYLDRNGIDVSYLDMRSTMWKHKEKYKEMTKEQYGKVGVNFYICKISMAMMFIFFIAAIISFLYQQLHH